MLGFRNVDTSFAVSLESVSRLFLDLPHGYGGIAHKPEILTLR